MSTDYRDRWNDRGLAILLALGAAVLVIHLLTGWRYGFHRDELATLDDARHIAWGYVAYPPVTPLFGWISLKLFGTSLTGFRFFAAVSTSAAVVLTGLMARELGGKTGAQALAASAAIPFALAAGSLMQYVSFDYLAWVACSYFFMFGVAISLLIFLPNLIWQIQNDFVSIDFLRHIHERDVRIGRTKDFLPDQLKLTLFTLPLAILGLCFYFGWKTGRRFRAIGFLYVIPLFTFLLAKGRGYYLAPAYPVLFAGGAVFGAELIPKLRPVWRISLRVIAWASALTTIFFAAVYFVPLAPVDSAWARPVFKINDDFREEIGWPELVEKLAQIRDSLGAQGHSRFGILAGNYGEAGAINLYGKEYGLPEPICGTNSFWARRYSDPPPETLIVIGFSREFGQRYFESCEVVGRITNKHGVVNEETTDHPEILLCRHLRESWPEFWRKFRRYG